MRYDLPLQTRLFYFSIIRIDDNMLIVRTPSEGVYRIKFEHVDLFATNNVHGLEDCFNKSLRYNRVLDWFDVESGGSSPHQLVNDLDSTIKRLLFYRSSRLDGKEYYDLLSVSHLDEEQMHSHEYSDVLTKFKIQKIAAKCGVNIILNLWKRDVSKVYKIVYSDCGLRNVTWRGPELEVFR